jgi:hypothetical protein
MSDKRPTPRGRRALQSLNFFMADMQAGVGPFLGVFLLAHGWRSGWIGSVMSLGGGYASAFLILGSFAVGSVLIWTLFAPVISADLGFPEDGKHSLSNTKLKRYGLGDNDESHDADG